MLSGCASESARPRPGVQEARSCMHHLQTTPKDFPDYKIRACTNTGVWLVDQMDPATGTTVAHYDFVNKDYTGPDTGGATLPIETLGGSQERDFLALQKTLNKALLN